MKERYRLLAGVIGSGLEWYDFSLYGCFATILAKLFFPTTNPFNAILATFGIFALGFLMRPIGGFVFGHYGDRIGRSKMLVITIFGMTFPTVMIGLLPSYQTIGIAAPLLLLLARLLQGFIIGGEYTGALLFIAEDTPAHKRGRIAALTMISAMGGLLLGSLAATILTNIVSNATIESWAWRIPFVCAIILGFIGYRLRRLMVDSQVFLNLIKLKKTVSQPALVLFHKHWRFVLFAIGICAMTGTTEYLLFTYFPSYIQKTSHLPLHEVLLLSTLGNIALLAILPLFAYLSDHIGRKPILKISAYGFLILTLPSFWLLSQPNALYIFLGILIFAVLIGIATAPMAALYIELFPTEVRYSGIAISYNIAFAFFGGCSPILCTWLVKLLHNDLAPAIVVIIATIISLICFYLMPETLGKELE